MNLREKLEQEAQRLAENQKEFETFRTVAEKLPTDLTIQSVTRQHAYRGELKIQLESVETVADVRGLLLQFPPVKLIQYKDSCLSFIPQETLRPKENTRLDAGTTSEMLIGPVIVSVEQFVAYPTKFEARWWSRINGVLCQLETEIKAHPLRIVPKYEEDYRGRRVKTGYQLNGLPVDWDAQITKFACGSPDNANPFTLWWYWDTDDEETRPEGFLPEPWRE
jgi:hypothetical protein